MGTDSKIEYTNHTLNLWIGCTKVSVGCDHCYAEAWCKRWGHDFNIVTRTKPATWRQPLAKDREGNYKWEPGDTVFVNTLSDFWHPCSDPWHQEAYSLMRQRPDLTWILCTKRPERINAASDSPLSTIFLTTAENQATLDARAPLLIANTFGRVRGISIEPMLGPIVIPDEILEQIDWVIVGGESGPHARPMHRDWVCSIRDQCQDPGQGHPGRPFFFKQWGEWVGGEFDGRKGKAILDDGTIFWTNPGHPKIHHWPRQDNSAYWTPISARVGKAPHTLHRMTDPGAKSNNRLLDGQEHRGKPTRKETP